MTMAMTVTQKDCEKSEPLLQNKPAPNPVLLSPDQPTMQYLVDKPFSHNDSCHSCATGLSDMDACWIKVLEPDALSASALQQQLSKLDCVPGILSALVSQNETLRAEMTALMQKLSDVSAEVASNSAAITNVSEVMESLGAELLAVKNQNQQILAAMKPLPDLSDMATEVHEQHAYLMARRNKKAKTTKYVLS